MTVSILPRCITVALALSIVSFFEGTSTSSTFVRYQYSNFSDNCVFFRVAIHTVLTLNIIFYEFNLIANFLSDQLHVRERHVITFFPLKNIVIYQYKHKRSGYAYFISIIFFFVFLVVGANSSLTAAVVVLTGLVGANFVQAMLDKLQFRDPIARGIATASRF